APPEDLLKAPAFGGLSIDAARVAAQISNSAFDASAKRQAAIHGKDLAGDKVWHLRYEQDGGSDVGGGPIAQHGSLIGQMPHESARCGAFAQINHSRGHAIYRDLRREGLGEELYLHVQ